MLILRPPKGRRALRRGRGRGRVTPELVMLAVTLLVVVVVVVGRERRRVRVRVSGLLMAAMEVRCMRHGCRQRAA